MGNRVGADRGRHAATGYEAVEEVAVPAQLNHWEILPGRTFCRARVEQAGRAGEEQEGERE